MVHLYDESYQALFVYGMLLCGDREQVKDYIHELFCEVWTKYDRLPEVKNVRSYLFTWLRRIIRKGIDGTVSPTWETELLEDSKEDTLIRSETWVEQQRNLQKALKNLSRKQQQVISLKYFENKSYEEIAALTNTSVRTVYNTVHEAIKNLKSSLIPSTVLIFLFF